MFAISEHAIPTLDVGRVARLLTVSKEAAALMSGKNPTSSTCSKKSWFSMPYTRSRKSTMDALWSGTKDADIFGCTRAPSVGEDAAGQGCPSDPPSPASLPCRVPPPCTFAQGGDLQWEADDAHEVIQGHQGAQDGTDPQGLALAGLD